MIAARHLWLGMLAVCLGGPIQAQPPVEIAWKLKEGERLEVKMDDVEEMTLVALGQNLKTEQQMVATLTVEKLLADGSVLLSQRIDAIETRGGGPASAFMDRILNEIKGSTIKLYLDSNFSVQKLEGTEEVIKRASDKAQLPPQAAALTNTLVTSTLLRPSERVFGMRMPDKPVARGDKWSQRMTSTLGALGKVTVVYEYAYRGSQDGKEAIDVKPTLTFAFDGGGGELAAKKADLRAETAKGNILFDRQAGKLHQTSMTMRIKGTLTISAMNQDIPLEIDVKSQTQTQVTVK
jgi:hypothetical protein